MSPNFGSNDWIGRVIGERYELLSRLSSSKVHAVFLVRDQQDELERRLRLLPPAIKQADTYRDFFIAQCERLRNLTHPNILDLLDFGFFEDYPYIVTPVVNGISLKEALAQHGALALPRVADLIEQLCDALGAGHEQDIVHGNLAPDTIYLLPDFSGQEQAYLVDFGLNTILSAAASLPHEKFETGAAPGILGNPQYMSPEQVKGNATSAASDIYSLGVVTYEMLIGEPPFPLLSGSAESVMDVLMRHATEAAPGLINRSPERAVPVAVEEVVLQTLAKKPSARPRSARSFARRFSEAASNVGEGFVLPQVEEETGGESEKKEITETRDLATAQPVASRPVDDEGPTMLEIGKEDNAAPSFWERIEKEQLVEAGYEPESLSETDYRHSDPPRASRAVGQEPGPSLHSIFEQPRPEPELGEEIALAGSKEEEAIPPEMFKKIIANEPLDYSQFEVEEHSDTGLGLDQLVEPVGNEEELEARSSPVDSQLKLSGVSLPRVSFFEGFSAQQKRLLPLIAGGVGMMLLLGIWLFSGGKEEPVPLAITDEGTMSGEPAQELSEPSQAALPVAGQAPQTTEIAAVKMPKIGRVNVQKILLDSRLGKQLQEEYLELYKDIKSRPDADAALERVNRKKTEVIGQLIAGVRQAISNYGEQNGYMLIVDETGKSKAPPFVAKGVKDLDVLLGRAQKAEDLNEKITQAFDQSK